MDRPSLLKIYNYPPLISQVEKYDGALLRKMLAITVVRQFLSVYRPLIENAVRTH
jgi:hypothetical protein